MSGDYLGTRRALEDHAKAERRRQSRRALLVVFVLIPAAVIAVIAGLMLVGWIMLQTDR